MFPLLHLAKLFRVLLLLSLSSVAGFHRLLPEYCPGSPLSRLSEPAVFSRSGDRRSVSDRSVLYKKKALIVIRIEMTVPANSASTKYTELFSELILTSWVTALFLEHFADSLYRRHP